MDKDYREKIRKLLALAESPNEYEAKGALLKARRLMAEHKLTEAELKGVDKKVKNIKTDITCSKRRNPWIVDLAVISGENYCCKMYATHTYGKQTLHIGFVGLEDDAEICVAIFEYAVDCILSEIRRIKKDNAGRKSSWIKKRCDSYGYGFANGLSAAFAKQQEESESGWGLVLKIPKEVEDATKHFKEKEFYCRAEDNIDRNAYHRGVCEGMEFDPTKRIAEEKRL